MNRQLLAAAALGIAAAFSPPPTASQRSSGRVGWAPSRSLTLDYHVTIEGVADDAKRVEAWIPLPRTDAHQTVAGIEMSGHWKYRTVTESEHGNRFLRVDLSRGPRGKGSILDVVVSYRVRRAPYRVLGAPTDRDRAQRGKARGETGRGEIRGRGNTGGPTHGRGNTGGPTHSGGNPDAQQAARAEAEGENVDRGTLARYLAPDRLVPLGGEIAREAGEVAGGSQGPLAKARALYGHIVETVRYDKSGAGWGRGDAVYACDIRAGNCTDFHSLFIAEARTLDIPARFIMGLPIPENATEGAIGGYHCWAEFYVEDYGWIPIDASEAHRFPEKRDAFFGGLDANRVAFTVGRDIRIPGAGSGPLNYVIYPYVEVDGKPYGRVTTRFSFRDSNGRDRG